MSKNILVIFLFVISFACKNKEQEEGWHNYKTPYFQIAYPEHFEFVKKGQYNEKGETMLQQAEFFLYVRDSAMANQKNFQPNINLLIQDLSNSSYGLSEFVEVSKNQILKLIKNAKILESVSQGNSHQIKYKGDLDERELHFYQQYELRNKQAYILTYSSPKDEFDRYFPTIKNIFESFEIK